MGYNPTPTPVMDGGTPPPSGHWIGYPPPYQKIEQPSEHLLCGGRYASCVHAGGLSCFGILTLYFVIFFPNLVKLQELVTRDVDVPLSGS